MTTPTPQEQAELFRNELRADLQEIRELLSNQGAEITNVRAELEHMREGLNHASQPAPASTTGDTFAAVNIEREKRKGKYYYKMTGGQFTQYGITIWDEVLEAMGLDKVEYSDDDTYKIDPPLLVRVSSEPYTDEEGKPKNRRKVTGKA